MDGAFLFSNNLTKAPIFFKEVKMKRGKLLFKCWGIVLACSLIFLMISACEEKKEEAKVAAPEKKAEVTPAAKEVIQLP